MSILIFSTNILISWLIADFASGLVHWYEDRAMVGQSRLKFLNGVRADNERHHKQPGYFIRLTWWQNINTTAPIAWLLAAALWMAGTPALLWSSVLFMGVGNLVHRWAHEHPENLPRPVYWMQKTGLFISASHHSGHHFKRGELVSREDSQIRFCVMTNWLNPILDATGFFRIIERIVK